VKKPDDFVQWLDELFTALELDKINLMGFSYGGWQASLYAISFPQRLNRRRQSNVSLYVEIIQKVLPGLSAPVQSAAMI
jgi:pimeloyl-ACP methyl ester carboxylesterase